MCGVRSSCERPFWIMRPQLTPLTSPTPKKRQGGLGDDQDGDQRERERHERRHDVGQDLAER